MLMHLATLDFSSMFHFFNAMFAHPMIVLPAGTSG